MGRSVGRTRTRGQRHGRGAAIALATVVVGFGGNAFAQDTSKTADPTKLDLTKDHVLYMVGYSHLDTEWCWSYPQVIKEFLPNTLHENFALFDKYPDYIFNWTGANRYRMMKDYYPDDYAKLKKYVAAGKWYPNGSSLEEGDVNNPSPEALIRQVLYGNEYFRKEFGVVSNEYMLPDCFGFPASLPSILAHCGVTGFSTQKLTWGSAVGIPFNVGVWNGPDGQGVVAALNPGSYTSRVNDDLSHDARWISRIDKDGQTSGVFADYGYYGVGDRGGAPDTNSVINVEKSLSAGGPVHVVSSRASDMFTAITPEERLKLPRYTGDLLLTWHSAGSITSQAIMKRWNRKNELLADSAERASVAASLLGAEAYPADRLTDAWWRFLPGQFHDLLAGTAMPKAYEFSQNDEVIAANEFGDVLKESVGGVIRGLNTVNPPSTPGTFMSGIGLAVVVYNPLSIPRTDIAELTLSSFGSLVEHLVVRGPNGERVPAQITDQDGKTCHIAFLASAPSVGFSVYHIIFANTPPADFPVRVSADSLKPAKSSLKITANSLENERYRVRLNTGGDIASVFDKKANKEMLSAPARLAFISENPAQYPAWNMDWEDQSKPPRGYVDGPAVIRIAENGPARVALEVTRHAEGSTFVQTIRLAAGDAGNRVEIANQIDWRSTGCVLKAVLPLTVSNPNATYNWGIGTVQRATDDPKKYEVPSHQWFDLTDTGGKYGVSVLEDCKNASDKPDDHTLRLTLLYTPGVRGGFQHQATQDWGRHEFIYALDGHTGDWRAGDSQWEAARLNQPLIPFRAEAHDGALGATFSLLSVSDKAVQVEALKKAEDSDEIIVRLNELTGKPVHDAHVKFAAPILSAREVNGQEQPLDGKPNVRGGELVFDMDPYRPRAFAIKLGKAPISLAKPKSDSVDLPYDSSVARAVGASSGGAFDADGKSIPAEMLPRTIESGGVRFKLAKADDKNAVTCRGQAIPLPAGSGEGRRLYILAASYGGDTTAAFQVDGAKPVHLVIQDWSGYIGQWDTRLWGGTVPELTYDWNNPLVGITPGYVKPATVAWYCDHWRLADGTNDPYRFCYLFRYAIDLPAGAKTLTFPNNEKVRILAASIADNANESARPAEPLSDTLADHKMVAGGPQIIPASGQFNDSIPVSLRMPLYYSGKTELHYTIDGSDPTAASPVAPGGAFFLNRRSTVRAVAIGADGSASSISSAPLDVSDHTPPSVLSATATGLTTLKVVFSEPLAHASAEDVKNYEVRAGASLPVTAAILGSDARTVLLTLGAPLSADKVMAELRIHGVADQSPAANVIAMATLNVQALAPVIAITNSPALTGTGRGVTIRQERLPVSNEAHWTINMFVYTDKQPDELTILGGFGDAADSSGAERFLIKYHDGIHFWGGGVDITSGVPLDLGKWQMLTATFDGQTVRIYKNGVEIKSGEARLTDAASVVKVGVRGPWDNRGRQFVGKITNFTVWSEALDPVFVKTLLAGAPAAP